MKTDVQSTRAWAAFSERIHTAETSVALFERFVRAIRPEITWPIHDEATDECVARSISDLPSDEFDDLLFGVTEALARAQTSNMS